LDSLITAGARALASVDALAALNCIALRDDPPALALRAIAMPQLGDCARARLLLRAAAAFGPREEIARARCVTVMPTARGISKSICSNEGFGRGVHRDNNSVSKRGSVRGLDPCHGGRQESGNG